MQKKKNTIYIMYAVIYIYMNNIVTVCIVNRHIRYFVVRLSCLFYFFKLFELSYTVFRFSV